MMHTHRILRHPPDHSLAAEGPAENLRNAQMLLGGLRRAVEARELEECATLVEAISARLDTALQQVETR